jgi:hypothetical protein
MARDIGALVAAVALCFSVGACASVTPTLTPTPTATSASPASPALTARPTIVGPAWVQAAAERWDPGSPQWNALAHPDVPYRLGGSADSNPNGITFTANLARRWWDAWLAQPVDRSSVPPGLQPGGMVLSADELKQVAKLQAGALPPAPAGYNPLHLPVLP